MSFKVHTLKRKKAGREKVQDVNTVDDPALVEKRLNAALRAGNEAWVLNARNEEVGRVERDQNGDLTLTLDRTKLDAEVSPR